MNWYKIAKIDKSAGGTYTTYHGSNICFDKFDNSKMGSRTDPGFFGEGIYFTPDKEIAGRWGNYVITAEVELNNPLLVTGISDWVAKTGQRKTNNKIEYANEIKRITEELKNKGYDGVIRTDSKGGQWVVAFDSSQITILRCDSISDSGQKTKGNEENRE